MLVTLFGIVNVAGSVNTFGVFGVRLNVVAAFIRMLFPTADVCRTVKLNVGPLVVVGKLAISQVD